MRSGAACSSRPCIAAVTRTTRSTGPADVDDRVEHLTDRQKARLEKYLPVGDPDGEVHLAWQAYQRLRAIYHATTPESGRRLAEQLIDVLHTCPIPEVARLGRTLRQWRSQILAYFSTGGVNNGGTEAICGFRYGSTTDRLRSASGHFGNQGVLLTESTFLARLVGARRLQPEPVATALLTHLLQRSHEARNVMRDLAGEVHPSGTFDALDYSEQAHLEGGEGRPDIVGATKTQVSLLVEAKFDAGLTSVQSTTGYLKGLGHKGLLMFLVPRDRVAPIWPKLLAGPIGMARDDISPAPDATTLTVPWLKAELPDGRCVGVTSWETLLSRLTPAVAGTEAASDMAQLAGLVQAHVAVEWVPATSDDLSPRTGRQLHRLRDAVREAATAVSLGKVANGTNDWGPARWVTNVDGRKMFWAGVRIPTWGRLGISPLWAVVIHRHPTRRKAAKDALAPLTAAGGPGVYELDAVTIGVPLLVPLGAELGEVKASLKTQLAKVRDLLVAEGTTSDEDSSSDVAEAAPGL